MLKARTEMADLLRSRRRAEQFARALDGDRSAYDPALEPLVAVATALRAAPEAGPAESFRAELRDRKSVV